MLEEYSKPRKLFLLLYSITWLKLRFKLYKHWMTIIPLCTHKFEVTTYYWYLCVNENLSRHGDNGLHLFSLEVGGTHHCHQVLIHLHVHTNKIIWTKYFLAAFVLIVLINESVDILYDLGPRSSWKKIALFPPGSATSQYLQSPIP